MLLRVVGSARLPQHDDLIRTKVDNFQQQTPFICPVLPKYKAILRGGDSLLI